MLDLYEELRSVIAALDQNEIDYALCGGIALAIYDRPRATVDIDLLIAADSLDEVVEVAKALEYKVRGLDMTFANDTIEIRRVSKIDQETGFVLSLDLLLVTPKIQQIWDSRVRANWEGGKLSVVSREGLIALKKLSGRPQDLADISALLEDAHDVSN
ncbi:MAG TPA: nucleotidyl transferase AbiEii/AbiGii toxin family protein [Pyrinomonadaceae bacterium]|nr:nucleotidyl transferase AbiEii/AbiGii toxin family protein [Pyrinomonadaceae bacterium]